MTDDVRPVQLQAVDDSNVGAVIALSVTEDQEQFVAPNVHSLAEAFATDKVWVRAIYAGETPVGFVMLSDDTDKQRYYIWRFMIDAEYQRRGFGRRAMELVHDYIRTRPGGTRAFLSYVPGDGGPEPFYRSLGYTDTGRVHDNEREAAVDL